VRRLLGIDLTPQEIAGLLQKLDFKCQVEGEKVLASTPPYPDWILAKAVVGPGRPVEEIAVTYGYNRLPATRLGEVLPAQVGNPSLEQEEQIKDPGRPWLAGVMTYRDDHRRSGSAPDPNRGTFG